MSRQDDMKESGEIEEWTIKEGNFYFSKIRTLLIEGFDIEELRRFCHDYPSFRVVYHQLSPQMGQDQVIDRLIEYAEHTLQIETLLDWAKVCNPARYEKHGPYLDPVSSSLKQSYSAQLLGQTSETIENLLSNIFSNDKTLVEDTFRKLEQLEPNKDGPNHQTLRQLCLQTMRDSGHPPQNRVNAGNVLARLGDPRFRHDAWYLPNESLLGFVRIPEGPFLMGSDKKRDLAATDSEFPQHEVVLPTYYIARYPVTAAQYQAFVNDSNYKSKGSGTSSPPNHPVVSITWYDSLAYCEWLTNRLQAWPETPEPLAKLLHGGCVVTLPSEAEWEKAARGQDGRIYPWGDEFIASRVNTIETNINLTSTVGCFPSGASPYGVEDLSGNVFEWTRSLWGTGVATPVFKYPYRSKGGRENLNAEKKVLRILRGGAFSDDKDTVRCGFRTANTPTGRQNHIGFRVVVSQLF